MPGKAPTLLLGLALVGVVFAMPLAAALSFGVDAASVPAMKNAGATPTYGQTWVGKWMHSSGWSGFESDLRTMRDNGVTPVIMWYYWGDSITPSCVTYGCSGMSRGDWDAMARTMASKAAAIMGSRTFYVVLEPEFNKAGISDMEAFDGYLESQAKSIKSLAPSVKIVVGFGHWGGWDKFDRAVAQSSLTGFQILRGSTRDSSSSALAAADDMIRISKALQSRFGKDTMVFDLGIATYGGWEWVQEKSLQNVIAKRGELDAAGVRAIVWRYVNDNGYSSGYYGPAESSWGVKYSWGGKKAAYDELVTLLQGSSTTAAAAPAPAPTSAPSAPTSGDAFSGVAGNEWWIQAKVAGSPTRVEASVNGGSGVALSYRSWGAWAASTHLPAGASVTLRASYADGSQESATYTWGASGPTSGGATASGFDATFSGVKVDAWWVQASVSGTSSLAKVEARVNGGAWTTLTKQSWGGYAKSIPVPSGGKVEFRATSTSGATDVSGAYWR